MADLVSREPLAAYPVGIRQTIVKMKAAVSFAVVLPEVVTLTRDITLDCRPNDAKAYIERVFMWNRKMLKYFPDPSLFQNPIQRLISPEVAVAEFRARGFYTGNCATLAMLEACMLGVLAVPARFVVIATPRAKGTYNHVLTEGHDGSTWTAMDFLTRYPSPESTTQPPLAWRV